MKILILSYVFPPLNSIASQRPHSWAKYWSKEGHEVTVFSGQFLPNPATDLSMSASNFTVYPIPLPSPIQWIRKKYAAFKRKDTVMEKVNVELRHKRGILNEIRFPAYTDFWIPPVLKKAKQLGPFDLVVSSSYPYAPHIAAYRLKKQGIAKRWIADFRDLWSEDSLYPGLYPFNRLEKFLEQQLMKQADRITTVSRPLATKLQRLHGNKIKVIENGFDTEILNQLDSSFAFPQDNKRRLLYTGSLHLPFQNPLPLFEALAKIKDPHLEVQFIGADNAVLQPLIDQYALSAFVKLLPKCSHEEALRKQRDADGLLFFPWNDATVDGILTGKLFEYLFSNSPILAIGCPQMEESQKLILECEAGLILKSTNEIIAYLKQKAKSKKPLSKEFRERYSRKTLAIRFLEYTERDSKF